MLSHFLKIAFRNFRRNKFFGLINLFGLAVSITCALLVIFHVKKELAYDQRFSRSDRIFRITQEDLKDGRNWAATAPPLGPSLSNYFTEVEQSVRFHRLSPDPVMSFTPAQGDVKRFEEKNGFFADASVTNVFDLRFVSGNAATALTETNSIVITEEMSTRYFGNENPLGKIIKHDATEIPFTVTGVIESFSFSTHLDFDYLLSMPTLKSFVNDESMQLRTWSGFYTYVLLKQPELKSAVESKLSPFMEKFYAPTGETRQVILSKRLLHLQPITDIHLYSKLEKEMSANSDITYVYIFSVAAFLIVLIACFNFINISTAQALKRVKEIGVRKLVGATRRRLVLQFLGESVAMAFAATLLAVLLCKLVIGSYNEMSGQNINWTDIFTISNALLLLGLMFGVGILGGIYPALFIANFETISSLRSNKVPGTSVNVVRKGLVVFQFAISVLMIFSTIIIYKQLSLFHQKELGFDKDEVIAIKMHGQIRSQRESLENKLAGNSSILSISASSRLPGERFSTQPFRAVADGNITNQQSVRIMWADDQLLQTLGISLAAGRNFFAQTEVQRDQFIVNEAAVKLLELKDPLGKTYIADRDTGVIVGIAKDFNFASLHSGIDPLVIQYRPERTEYMLVKTKGAQVSEILQFIESAVKDLAPTSIFSYTFLDEQLNLLYESENKMSNIFKVFAVFSILISCLGLFGLSAYAARIRTKEVGIRKVLGASVFNVTILLSKDFMALVLIAILFALPTAAWLMNKWLQGFAYRVDIDPSIFILSAGCAIIIAFLTVSIHVVKVGLINPVKSLKSE